MQNQLAIRVQLKKPEAKAPAKDHLEIYWGRIVGAALLVALLVFALQWGWRLSGPAPEAGSSAMTGHLLVAENPGASEPLVNDLAPSVETPRAEEPILKAPSSEQPSVQESGPTGTGRVAAARPTAAPLLPNSTMAEAPRAERRLPTPAAATALKPEVGSAASVASSRSAGAAVASPASLAPVTVLSEHVSSAVLTDSRERGSPGQPLGARVRMAGQGLITLYLFTRYENLQGQWVYHDWYLNGEQVASVRARPHKSTMDIHSSKYIDRYMTGKWEVRVHTEAGEQLAKAAVEVVR